MFSLKNRAYGESFAVFYEITSLVILVNPYTNYIYQ